MDASDPGPVATPTRSRLRIAVLAAVLIAVGAALSTVAFGFTRDPNVVTSPLVGRAAPAFRLISLDGEWVDLRVLRGRAVMLNFWASWCVPCRAEAPLLVAADDAYSSRGLVILGVVFQDGADNARAFMEQYGQRYPGLLDADSRTAVDYGVFGIPETFFIDRDGIIISKHTGQLDSAALAARIEEVLK